LIVSVIAMQKIDDKKELKQLCSASAKQVAIIEMPTMKLFDNLRCRQSVIE
jgi:hypothetical protein